MNIENELIDNESTTTEIGVSPEIVSHLKETRKWTNFIAIMGFIMLFFIFIAGISLIANNKGTGAIEDTTTMGMSYLFSVIIYFFPLYYLVKFSINTKKAIKTNSKTLLEEAFLNLKFHYRFIGISMIIMFSIMIIAGFVSAFAVSSGNF